MNAADADGGGGPAKIELPRIAKGKRPAAFPDPMTDHLVTMVLELSAELYTVYSRLDTVERLIEQASLFDRSRIDAYRPSEPVEAEREAWRELFFSRLLRTIKQERG